MPGGGGGVGGRLLIDLRRRCSRSSAPSSPPSWLSATVCAFLAFFCDGGVVGGFSWPGVIGNPSSISGSKQIGWAHVMGVAPACLNGNTSSGEGGRAGIRFSAPSACVIFNGSDLRRLPDDACRLSAARLPMASPLPAPWSPLLGGTRHKLFSCLKLRRKK